MLGRLRVGQATDVLPGIVGHGRGDAPPTFIVRGGSTGDKQGVPECGQIVLGHPRSLSDVDVGSWCDPVRRQERRNVR